MSIFKENTDAHIFLMTDDTGMFQHTCYNVPDLSKGYTTDDNARALLMAVMLYEKSQQAKYLALVYRYLAFVLYAQNEEGHFRNFMTYNREFTETQGSEECFGRCLWALSFTLTAAKIPGGIKAACRQAINRAWPQIASLKFLRGQAYVLLALGFLPEEEKNKSLIQLADFLANHFANFSSDKNWQWFEDNLTYDNALLPWAMFAAYQQTGKKHFRVIAEKSLDFLDQQMFKQGFFQPIGCNGWWLRGSEAAVYDQQPLEASMSTLAHLTAYTVTGDKKMLKLARQSFAWYHGANSGQHNMINPETGGCFDGITAIGVNLNQGAESLVGYWLAALALEKVLTTKKH